MPVSIVFPPNGTAQEPVRLPRRFVAVGRRDNLNQQMLGVVLSHDGKHRIGGQTLKYNPENEDPLRWAIYFRIPRGVRRDKRLKLVVFNSADLPGQLSAQPTYVSDYLFVRNERRTRAVESGAEAPARGRSVEMVEGPVSGGTASRADFYAFGILPAGNNDIDMVLSEVVDAADASQRYQPIDKYVPGDGFWVAYFPQISASIDRVHLTIVYAPNGDEDGVNDIELT